MDPAPPGPPGPEHAGAPVAAPLPLPPAVRERIAALASDRLGALAPDTAPAALRRVARFTPAKRARLAAGALVRAVDADALFRAEVAEGVRESLPDLVAGLEAGHLPPEALPEEVAAVAYVVRPPDWQDHVKRSAALLQERAQARQDAAAAGTAARLAEQLEASRNAAREEVDGLRRELTTAREETAALRRKVREMGDRAGRAEAAARLAQAALEQERARVDGVAAKAQAETARLARRLEEAEESVRAARQAAREGRAADELRLRVLLDALLGAASGLRRELALPPADGRPADAVAADYLAQGSVQPPSQGRGDDDPALLDALLQVPLTHLLVDGYNITKTGYGDLSLEAQRVRLLAGLGALGARTGAEVTVVFDGAERATPVAPASPRGVRLLFSRPDETADDVLVRLVRVEPPGRPVLVASDDQEVAERVGRSGGRRVTARALLRLLDRA